MITSIAQWSSKTSNKGTDTPNRMPILTMILTIITLKLIYQRALKLGSRMPRRKCSLALRK